MNTYYWSLILLVANVPKVVRILENETWISLITETATWVSLAFVGFAVVVSFVLHSLVSGWVGSYSSTSGRNSLTWRNIVQARKVFRNYNLSLGVWEVQFLVHCNLYIKKLPNSVLFSPSHRFAKFLIIIFKHRCLFRFTKS
jgi:hypothetical protein